MCLQANGESGTNGNPWNGANGGIDGASCGNGGIAGTGGIPGTWHDRVLLIVVS
jgi:hypothetical protein